MVLADLDKPAELTLQPTEWPDHTAEARMFPSLREALKAAVESIRADDTQPWIIAKDSDIRSLRRIQANTCSSRLQ